MGEVGRNTLLTTQAFRQIRQAVLDGKNLKEIAAIIGVDETTVYAWSTDNYLNFADKVDGWRRDRLLKLAERNIEEDLQLETVVPVVTMVGILKNKETGEVVTKVSPELRKIRSNVTMFTAETLGSGNYSKKLKSEHSFPRSLEDLIDEAEKEDEQEPTETDAGAFVDSEQKAQGAEIPAQQSANGLPQQSDPATPAPNNNTQG